MDAVRWFPPILSSPSVRTVLRLAACRTASCATGQAADGRASSFKSSKNCRYGVRSRRRRWPRSSQWEGIESHVPELGTVVGSPDRQAVEAAIHSPLQPDGEKLRRSSWGRRSSLNHCAAVTRRLGMRIF